MKQEQPCKCHRGCI